MRHYLDLVPISAKIHRKQNRMSIFCIVLAVFLVTAIFGMADMFIRSQLMQAKIDGGDYHIAVKDITDEEAALIAKRPDVKEAALYGVLNFRGEQGYTFLGKQAILVGCDEEYVTKLQVHMVDEGRFPQAAGEVMATKSVKENFGLQIGDTETIGRPGDTDRTYRITGFSNNAAKTMSEDSYGFFLTTAEFREIYPVEKSETLADYNTILCIQLSETRRIQSAISTLKEECGLSDEHIMENTKLLGLLGQSTNSFMTQTYLAAMILFVLVLGAGIMMITSSLNSNVAQRTEFFGLMRCIGATPKQVMRLVRKEAISWCRLAIPVGIGMGTVVIWVLCAILRILSPEYFEAIPVFSFSIPSMVAGAAIGLLTVLLAARSPAKKAAKVSPLAAVSGNASDLHPARTAANTKLFRAETALGIHHAVSSRKNFVFMVLSFSLSVVLFLSFSVSITFIYHALKPLRPWTADLSILSPDNTCSIDSGLVEKIKDNSHVKAVYGRMFSYDAPITGKSGETLDLISYEEKQFGWAKDYLLEGSIETAQREINTGLVVHSPQNTIAVGDVVDTNIGGNAARIKIVGKLSESPFNLSKGSTVICSEDTFRQVTGQNGYTVIDVQLGKKATDQDVSAIRQMAGSDLTFSDERLGNESTRGIYYCMWLFLYGFLVLVALITVFNIINSIGLSVAARTKQYGAFRAIGLTTRQLWKMILAEAVTYTSAGTIIGTALGLVFHRILFQILVSGPWGEPWVIPWTELGIIILVMVVSVVLAVYGPMKRLRGMSIVENINA